MLRHGAPPGAWGCICRGHSDVSIRYAVVLRGTVGELTYGHVSVGAVAVLF